MYINTVLLVLAAVLPALLLCNYVYKKDRVEKEPMGLLLLLFFAGVFSCFPAAEVEVFLDEIITGIFNGLFFLGLPIEVLSVGYNAVKYFIGVALVEEGFKWLFLVVITKNNKNFNCLFDGMIYAVFVSLGFAAFENILYVVEYGWMNAIARAILSVPGHMFFSVMMGYYYSRWVILKNALEAEKELVERNVVEKRDYPEFNYKKEMYMSLIVPIVFHGTYNFCCSLNSILATIAFYGFVIFMYIHCFSKIKETSIMDTPTGERMVTLLLDKYPELYETAGKN